MVRNLPVTAGVVGSAPDLGDRPTGHGRLSLREPQLLTLCSRAWGATTPGACRPGAAARSAAPTMRSPIHYSWRKSPHSKEDLAEPKTKLYIYI